MLKMLLITIRLMTYILLILTLFACAASPNNEPNRYYSLSFIGNSQPAAQADYPFLKIGLPNFSSKHHTEAIIYANRQHELDRYSQSEWKEPLPILLQEWLLQSLEYSNLFEGVMRGTSRAQVSLFLESDIIKFQHNVKQQMVEMSLRLTLLDYRSRKIVKHRIFNYQNAVSDSSAKGAVTAFNQVLLRFNQDLYAWLSI